MVWCTYAQGASGGLPDLCELVQNWGGMSLDVHQIDRECTTQPDGQKMHDTAVFRALPVFLVLAQVQADSQEGKASDWSNRVCSALVACPGAHLQ